MVNGQDGRVAGVGNWELGIWILAFWQLSVAHCLFFQLLHFAQYSPDRGGCPEGFAFMLKISRRLSFAMG
jgi:hypothetical protein